LCNKNCLIPIDRWNNSLQKTCKTAHQKKVFKTTKKARLTEIQKPASTFNQCLFEKLKHGKNFIKNVKNNTQSQKNLNSSLN